MTANNNDCVRILALDTATEFVSAALATDDSVTLRAPADVNRHSETLLPLVDELMTEAGCHLADVTAVAFGAGPGAFTGLRVACGVAQGLAWGAEKPVLMVSTLAATALASGRTGKILVTLDARMGECYAGLCTVSEDGKVNAGEPSLIKPEAAGEMAAGADAVVGSALAVHLEKMNLPAGIATDAAVRADASHIALVGAQMWAEGLAVPADEAAPLYVRNRVALTIDQRRAGEKL